jgi:hypothetical protein
LYTYRVSEVFEFIEPVTHRHFHPSRQVQVQPWWSVPAAIAVLCVGLGVTVWLLPTRRRLLNRAAARFVKPT